MLASLKRVNAKGAPEESIALRVSIGVAVMAAGTAVARQQGSSPLLLAVVLIGLPAAFWYSWWARHRDGYWLKAGLAIAVVFAFGQFLSAASGSSAGPASLAQLQRPLAELFLWVQLLHALDVPARRDLRFSLLSSTVLMAVAGVLSLSMAIAPLFLVWGVAAGASLVLAHRSEVGGAGWLASPGGAGTGGGSAGVDGFPLRSIALVAGAVLAAGSVVFQILPPAGTARALTFPSQLPSALPVPVPGGLSNPALGDGGVSGRSSGQGRESFGYFGFADELDTGVRGRPDDSVVMRVRASRPDFWRGQTFDSWDGRRWTMSATKPTVIEGLGGVIDVPRVRDAPTGGDELVQTYYIERPGPNLIFGAYSVDRVHFADRRLFQLPDGTLRTAVRLDAGSAYTVVSRRLPLTASVLRIAPDPSTAPSGVRARYAQPPVATERVRRLAADVTATASSTYDKVRALEAWLAANTEYSLDIPRLAAGADAVDTFLFEDRIGFCEQIGTSLVVMLRSLGIPARLVAGYAPGQRNPFTGLYEVKASDAHAWAEVYFPGIGWQAFDPTANVPLAGDGGFGRAGAGLGAYLASALPLPPASVVLAVAVVGGVAGLLVGGVVWVRRRRARRPVVRGWAEAGAARLEAIGAARGRPRWPQETITEYSLALVRSGAVDDRGAVVGRALSGDVHNRGGLSPEDRAEIDRLLTDLATTPTPAPAAGAARSSGSGP